MELVGSFRIEPFGAVRLSRRDYWESTRTKAAARYFAYKDELRAIVPIDWKLPDNYHLVFYLTPPASWSQKKRKRMIGEPHRQKPDKDNLEKAFLDALYGDDSAVYDGRVTKFWAEEGEIVVYAIDPPDLP